MTAGLARFVGSRAALAPVGAASTSAPAATVERCELCGAAVPEGHNHLVDPEARGLLCACRACALLFTNPGAGRYSLVPDRVRADPGIALRDQEWEELQIPVGMAFFFRHSVLDRWVAFYPSPAGATESVLPLDAWQAIVAAHPTLAGLQSDSEALLVRWRDGRSDCYLVPIDICYELVGLVRMEWRGFDGGQELHDALAGFFNDLDRRSQL